VSQLIRPNARVSSADQKEDVERQMQRLLSYAAAKGYAVSRAVTEIASSLNDNRPKLMSCCPHSRLCGQQK
jgi:predicted site-specific integrase-resolvase